jgi:hypothetical protein
MNDDANEPTLKQQLDEAFAVLIASLQAPNPARATRPRKRNDAIGPVYFLRCEGFIKIGYSIAPRKRLSQIRGGDATRCPEGINRSSIVLVQTEPGGRQRERQLHQQFKHLHHWGEWFTEAPELTEYIESLSERQSA